MTTRRSLYRGVFAALLLLGATEAALANSASCRAPLERWTEIDLYFGRNIAGVGEVSEQQFRNFLADTVTPRFPDGLSVVDVAGQFRTGKRIIRENAKLVVLLVPDVAAAAPKVAAIVGAYRKRFRQQSVLRTEASLCLAFD